MKPVVPVDRNVRTRRDGKGVAVAYFKVIPHFLPRWMEDNQETPLQGPRFEHVTTRILSTSGEQNMATFGWKYST
jgi:hypothetical protein